MTEPDSLEKIVEEVRSRARGVVIFDPSGQNVIPDREWMNLIAARIEALIPISTTRWDCTRKSARSSPAR